VRKHFTIAIKGRVQGVFFRASAKAKADELGLNGIVKNRNDGSVYCEVEGDEEKVALFISWCHQGPKNAIVNSCEATEGQLKNFQGFLIVRD
jgi:acylphosphatase